MRLRFPPGPPAGLRVRLALWYLVLFGVVVTIFGSLLYMKAERVLINGVDTDLTARIRMTVNRLRTAGTGLSHGPLAPSTLQSRPPQSAGSGSQAYVYLYLVDGKGQLLLRWASPNAPPPLNPPDPQTLQAADAGRPSRATHGDWRVVTLPLRNRSGALSGVIQGTRSLNTVQDQLKQLRTWLVAGLALLLALATAGGLFITGWALAPVDRIIRTAQVISAGDLKRRLGLAPRTDEVGRLAATFDGMMDRLEHAFAQQREFTAAASHELRTPLTIMKGDLDVLLRRRRTPSEYEEVLRGVNEEVLRLSHLVEDLLTLARADSGQAEVQHDLVALDDLVEAVTEGMRRLAGEAGITLTKDPAPSVVVVGDRLRLHQLILNLIGNAVKYTSAGGSIRVSLTVYGDRSRLDVADTGIGIGPEDLPHVFAPFYRADKARSRAEGGTGLGLAIARWCAEVHGGSITVTSSPGAGSTFTVWLPLALSDDDAKTIGESLVPPRPGACHGTVDAAPTSTPT